MLSLTLSCCQHVTILLRKKDILDTTVLFRHWLDCISNNLEIIEQDVTFIFRKQKKTDSNHIIPEECISYGQ